MKLTRLNNDKNLDKVVLVMELELKNRHYRLTEEYGMLRIHAKQSNIKIIPHCANEISVEIS
jgi:hypothetical protein